MEQHLKGKRRESLAANKMQGNIWQMCPCMIFILCSADSNANERYIFAMYGISMSVMLITLSCRTAICQSVAEVYFKI